MGDGRLIGLVVAPVVPLATPLDGSCKGVVGLVGGLELRQVKLGLVLLAGHGLHFDRRTFR